MTKTMVESIPPNPNSIEPPATAGDPPPPPPPPLPATDGGGGFLSLPRRPGIRLTTEFDSDSSIFFNKISCKLLDSLAKLKLSFQNNDKGEISEPQLALTSKYLSLHYDLEEHNALIKSSFDVGPALHLRAAHDVKRLVLAKRKLIVEDQLLWIQQNFLMFYEMYCRVFDVVYDVVDGVLVVVFEAYSAGEVIVSSEASGPGGFACS
ncbi:hypothetical protein HYC85_012436 [Camellia sinensis]|uniref:Uncharacterized protein n=1 Tax=Camellia sinensis TaxID=4442 RepID=A0A7J7HBX6_CAMSI|nr:hypothetical protein HYC85_012436 [Camellia sinensis]